MNAGECSLNSQHCTYDTCQNRSDVLVNDCLLWPLPSFFFLSLLSLADCIFPHIALMYKTVLTLQSGALVKRKCGSLGGEVGRSEFSTSTLSFYESNGLTNTLFFDWFSTWQTGQSRCWRVCRTKLWESTSILKIFTDDSNRAHTLYWSPRYNPSHYTEYTFKLCKWNFEWSGIASGRKFTVKLVFSSLFPFLHGTSLKRTRDNFPLHGFVIIWEGKFIWGHTSPGAKRQEPHHSQADLVCCEIYQLEVTQTCGETYCPVNFSKPVRKKKRDFLDKN